MSSRHARSISRRSHNHSSVWLLGRLQLENIMGERQMKARIFLAGSVLATGALFSTTALADSLTIAAWGGTSQEAQRIIYFDPFSEETGVSITEDEFLGGIGVLRTQVMGGAPTW